MPSVTAAATSPMTMAAATGAATDQPRRARRKATADAAPAATLGISTLSTTNQDDRAWVSVARGGTTSDTMSWRPDRAARAAKAPLRACSGPVPPAWVTSSRRFAPEATSAPSTSRCAIPVVALAALP